MREKEPGLEDFGRKKTVFFDNLAQKHLPQMRLLFRGGKLWEKESWRNVVEHSLVVMAAALEISDLLELNEQDREKLIKAAACHDWDKRLKRKPEDFDDEDKEKAQGFLKKTNPDRNLLAATSRGFVEKFSTENTDFLEKVIHYVDAIVFETEISQFRLRFEGSGSKYKDLNAEFWRKNAEITSEIEKEIFEVLRSKDVQINSPGEIPYLIKGRIEKRIEED